MKQAFIHLQLLVPMMPASFFDLPRELRDFIYFQVLVSPTGYVEPVLVYQTKKSPSPRFALYRAFPIQSPLLDAEPGPQNDVLSLSLMRTCRQIYHETQSLFWKHNTFQFSTPHLLTQTLKSMGQIPSRKITSISLTLTLSSSFSKTLPRALRILVSRARHGAFRRLSLEIGRMDLIRIASFKTSVEEKRIVAYDNLLAKLRDGGAGSNFDRCVNVETMLRNWRIQGSLDHDTIREVHLAWGGKMYCNGELEWENYVHIGNCVGR
jgi:hypothetical protein